MIGYILVQIATFVNIISAFFSPDTQRYLNVAIIGEESPDSIFSELSAFAIRKEEGLCISISQGNWAYLHPFYYFTQNNREKMDVVILSNRDIEGLWYYDSYRKFDVDRFPNVKYIIILFDEHSQYHTNLTLRPNKNIMSVRTETRRIVHTVRQLLWKIATSP